MKIGDRKLHDSVERYVRFIDDRCAWCGDLDDGSPYRKFKTSFARIKWIVLVFEMIIMGVGLSFDDNFGMLNGTFVYLPVTFMQVILSAVTTYKWRMQEHLAKLFNEEFITQSEPWMEKLRKEQFKFVVTIVTFIKNYQYCICIVYFSGPIVADLLLHYLFDYLTAPIILPGPVTSWFSKSATWDAHFWAVQIINLFFVIDLITTFQWIVADYSILSTFFLGELKILTVIINELNLLSEETMNEQFRKVISKHNNVIRMNENLKDYLGLSCALLSFYTSITLTLIAFSIYTIPNLTVTTAYSAAFTLFFSVASLYSYLGQQLENESDKIFKALYNLNWYFSTPRVRKTLNMMMRQARTPLMIDYHGRYKMNFNNFMQVLRSSYSYFTLLQSMTSKT